MALSKLAISQRVLNAVINAGWLEKLASGEPWVEFLSLLFEIAQRQTFGAPQDVNAVPTGEGEAVQILIL